MNATGLKNEIVKDIVSKGCNISYELLDHNLSTLITQAKIDALKAHQIDIIGDSITEPEPMYRCVHTYTDKGGLTFGKLYKVYGNSFYDNEGYLRNGMADVYLDMNNPIYPHIEPVTDPQL